MFEISNLTLSVNNKELFNNLNLKINSGEIHVLMGKNGVGKSSIAKAIMGDNNYKVDGSIKYNGKEITKMSISDRAKEGIYLLNQSPIQVEGVTNAEMLRLALGEKTGKNVNIFEFSKELEKICQDLELDKSFIHREINVGCSGGERKKIELMHMWMLKPSMIILDEVDSGLDVDAIKLVGNSLKKYYELYKPTILIITHTASILNMFEHYKVHLLNNKGIILTKDESFAKEILDKGFKKILEEYDTFVISEN